MFKKTATDEEVVKTPALTGQQIINKQLKRRREPMRQEEEGVEMKRGDIPGTDHTWNREK